MSTERLIFEKTSPGRQAFYIPSSDVDVDVAAVLPASLLRKEPLLLPEMSEQDLVRHYTRLSQRNMGIDTQMVSLGSCTMKYNPKVNEDMAGRDGLKNIHPYQPTSTVQGALELMYDLERWLLEISGLDAICLQPSAGAQGELTSLLVARAYHDSQGRKPTKVLVPDSSHGTNPASAALCGYEAVTIKSTPAGRVDLEDLKAHLDESVACMMMTNPNTLGIFETEVKVIADMVHEVGALLYYDGANLNAVCGLARPRDMGCDMMHFNVHKTFATPHGGGGPGAGPIGVKKHLQPFLPIPRVVKLGGKFDLDYAQPQSIGRVRSAYGNFGILVRGLVYLYSFGADGVPEISKNAILNANYLLSRLKDVFEAPMGDRCMHEFVLSLSHQKKEFGCAATDYAKRLADYGYHAPTVYFPMNVSEAMMIEPTETESKQTLDDFADTLIRINDEAKKDSELLHHAPTVTPVGRLDEVGAARHPNLRWRP